MVITNMICAYHEVLAGSIELACDGLSALNKAFPYEPNIYIQDPNYDLIAVIHHERTNSPITWMVRHVKGHQDDTTYLNLLDR